MEHGNHLAAPFAPRASDTDDLKVVSNIAAGLGDSPAASDPSGTGPAAADLPAETPADAAGDDELYQRRLGARLRAVRRTQDLRLQDVEQRSDGRFKAVVVGSYERGDRAVSAHKLAALAAFYGVPVSELLPEDDWPRRGAPEPAVQIAVDRLRRGVDTDPSLAPLRRLVQHVQWLRGDYNGTVLSLRGDDLRTVAVALGVDANGLEGWLDERDLLAG